MPSPKEIRFGKLVEKFGTPEVLTLWADPKKDAAFMRLVKKGRVLTLIQKPTGTKKDFGLIDFHPQPFATYLVFPKSLGSDEDAIVIGIKYDLLKKSEGRIIGDATPAPKPKPVKPVKPAPKRKSFEVTVRRRASLEVKISVEAFNAATAKKQALAELTEQSLSVPAEDTENNVISVAES